MSVTTDKEGHKHYRMKMDTGYIDSKGNDLNAEKNHEPTGKHLQFNYVLKLVFPMKRIAIQVPGFTEFGLKYISITEMKTGNIIFSGRGFTIFKMTRCGLPRQVTRQMVVGEKYKITIQK